MDAYTRFNQINVDPLDTPKNSCMYNNYNYHYKVMAFSLKNTSDTY